MLADDLRLGGREDLARLAHLEVVEDADHAVRVVPGQIGIDQRVADHRGDIPGRADADQQLPHEGTKVGSGDNRHQ